MFVTLLREKISCVNINIIPEVLLETVIIIGNILLTTVATLSKIRQLKQSKIKRQAK